jgi:uncharacterized protein YjbJ (UPF0337 family)
MERRTANGQVNRKLQESSATRLQKNHAKSTEPKSNRGTPQEHRIMDKNRTQGAKREFKGTVKEVTGNVTGDKSKEVAGNIEKNTGKAQKHVGQAADHMRDAAHKRDDVE